MCGHSTQSQDRRVDSEVKCCNIFGKQLYNNACFLVNAQLLDVMKAELVRCR